MPNKGFVPGTDGDFYPWFKNYHDRIVADPARYGVSPSDLAELVAAYTDWQVKYPAHTTALSAARAAAQDKDISRDVSEVVIRRTAKLIQSRKETTNVHREELGITVPDTTRTPLSAQVVLDTPPPILQAVCTGPKFVRLDFYPTQAPGQSEALPEGMIGAEIYVAEGGIPSDESQWDILALDTNSPYVHNAANDVTVTMAYKARWVDRRGRKGPFGSPIVVAVTA